MQMQRVKCYLVRVKQLLKELNFFKNPSTKLISNTEVDLFVSFNQVFRERTKHIEIGFHCFREKHTNAIIVNVYVTSLEHLIYTLQFEGEC
ncbi:hypothetical protein Hanom_Chr06g00518671 [Helianthus anomalus]